MTAPSKLVAELVHQFADPLAFYRELIQNSLDAGSTRIEVVLRYQPGNPGVATAAVCDWGEGMTRQTIERYLLTKFRSSKEGDLTKIGKYGVGFMSVLAPAPQLVVVDTGRDGDDWRLLLEPDFSYELRRAPEPLEGTRVTLHKEMSPPDYRAWVDGSRAAVRRWCKHAEADIFFSAGGSDGSPPGEPEPVRTPFVVDAPFQVEHREEGTLVVAGVARVRPAPYGFYNRGLTLLEGDQDELMPGVTFKIQSRYLEHTITRDDVRRDKHFTRAMKLVGKLVEGSLTERLPGELRQAAETGSPDTTVLLRFAHRKLDRQELWFPLAAGGAIDGKSLRRSARRHGAVHHAAVASPLVTALELPVLREGGAELQAIVQELTGRACVPASQVFTLAAPGDETAAARALAEHFQRLARLAGARFERCVVAHVTGAAARRLVARVDAPGTARRVPEDETIWSKGAPVACLNPGHERVRAALVLAESSPALAALLLARVCAAGAGVLDAERDRALTEAALA